MKTIWPYSHDGDNNDGPGMTATTMTVTTMTATTMTATTMMVTTMQNQNTWDLRSCPGLSRTVLQSIQELLGEDYMAIAFWTPPGTPRFGVLAFWAALETLRFGVLAFWRDRPKRVVGDEQPRTAAGMARSNPAGTRPGITKKYSGFSTQNLGLGGPISGSHAGTSKSRSASSVGPRRGFRLRHANILGFQPSIWVSVARYLGPTRGPPNRGRSTRPSGLAIRPREIFGRTQGPTPILFGNTQPEPPIMYGRWTTHAPVANFNPQIVLHALAHQQARLRIILISSSANR